jgi:hypothetical protein
MITLILTIYNHIQFEIFQNTTQNYRTFTDTKLEDLEKIIFQTTNSPFRDIC